MIADRFSQLVFHTLAHVPLPGPGNVHDPRYVARAAGRFDAGDQQRLETTLTCSGACGARIRATTRCIARVSCTPSASLRRRRAARSKRGRGWPMRYFALLSSLLLAACAARPAEDDEAGVTTKADATGASTSESNSSTAAETPDEGDGDGDEEADGDGDDACHEPIKLDAPSDREAPMPEACTVEWIPWPTPEQYPGCELCQIDLACAFEAYLGCVTPAAHETCADICPSGDCLGVYWEACEGELEYGSPWDTCGHYEIDGQCCTIGKFVQYCAE